MPLQGPFAVIADQPARDVVEALRAAGAYPIIEARWADAAAVLQARPAQAVILAEGCADRARAAVLEKTLNVQAEQEGIASVLRKVMLAADNKAGAEPAVTLATLKPGDTTDSLIARVVEEPPKPA